MFFMRYFVYFRYKDALISLIQHILHKLLFKHNQSQLEELDDDTFDYDVSSMLLLCADSLVKIEEIRRT